tara:strand:- start:666 stop:1436 length:771 start_codon:yes stop_codon:yes gene_type:complete
MISDKDKIIYIDIGTHKGQEFSAFNMNKYSIYYKLIKHNLISLFSKRHKFLNLKKIKILLSTCQYIRRNRKLIFSVLVEPNFVLLNNKSYKYADAVIQASISKRKDKNLSLKNLFIPLGDSGSQSSSLYKKKFEGNTNSITTLSLNPNNLFKLVKDYLKNITIEYSTVVLRVNNEGNEDECIYSLCDVFDDKKIYVMGSLDDVYKIKGYKSYENLEKYLLEKKLSLYKFSTILNSWIEPTLVIKKIIEKINAEKKI